MTQNPILAAMAERLAQPEHWTRYSGARDASTLPTHATDPDATCWCIIGARARALADAPTQVGDARDALRRLTIAIRAHWDDRIDHFAESPNEVIATFNDHFETTHADVVRLLEIASA